VDVLVSFRTSYQDNEGVENMDGKKIAKNYVKSGRFFFDFLGSFPFDRIIESFLGPKTYVEMICKISHLFNPLQHWLSWCVYQE
jgi:hypothetical protein